MTERHGGFEGVAISARKPARLRAPLIVVAVLAATAALAACLTRSSIAQTVTGPVETEPRAVERLIAEGSPVLVQVTMEADRLFHAPGSNPPWHRVETRRIDFHVPAVSVRLADTREGRSGPQRLGFGVWSRSFDPVRADEMADIAEFCPTGTVLSCPGLANGRQATRIQNGEVPLWVEVTNIVGTDQRRAAVLRHRAGHDRSGFLDGPCEVRDDPVLGMLVGRPPEGARVRACGGIAPSPFPPPPWDRSGRQPRLANFLKLDPGGTPRFVVICLDWVEDSAERSTGNCRVEGYLREWPLFFSVPNNRADAWEAMYDSVQSFLERHLVQARR